GDLLHVDAELADVLRPVAARRQHEDRRVDARAVQAAHELVELILGPSLAELADHVGDAPRLRHATASSARPLPPPDPSPRAARAGAPGARAARRADAARARGPTRAPAG